MVVFRTNHLFLRVNFHTIYGVCPNNYSIHYLKLVYIKTVRVLNFSNLLNTSCNMFVLYINPHATKPNPIYLLNDIYVNRFKDGYL